MKSIAVVGLAALLVIAPVAVANAKEVRQDAGPSAPTPLSLFYGQDLTAYQWWADAVGAPAAHQAGYTGKGVVVAVIDSGIDVTHPDLAGQLLSGADTTTGEVVPQSAEELVDDVAHGTHVAGIIAAKDDGGGITGVAPDAKILPIKPLTGGMGDANSIAVGIDWAVEQGADVINLSLGMPVAEVNLGTDYDPLCKSIDKAVTAGVVVVVAAGNSGDYGNPLSSPAGCPGALSVSAINSNGVATGFTNFDPTVSISAPGADVLSSVPASMLASGYFPLSGTSMATPIVAGVAALLKQQDPELTPAQLTEKLKAGSIDLGRKGPDPLYGAGLVSAPGALGISSSPNTWANPPHVIAAYTSWSAASDVIVGWSLPGDQDVAQYEISEFPTGKMITVADGDQVRAQFPGSAMATGIVQVTAVLADGTRLPSEPAYLGTQEEQQTSSLQFTATWTKRGIKVTVFRDKTTQDDTVTISLSEDIGFAPPAEPGTQNERKPFSRDVELAPGQNSVIVPVKATSQLRGRQLWARYDDPSGWSMGLGIQPDWPFDLRLTRINAYQVVASGSVNFCPNDASEKLFRSCAGRSVALLDQAGNTLARTAIVTSQSGYGTSESFSAVLSSSAKKVSVAMGTHRSAPYRMP